MNKMVLGIATAVVISAGVAATAVTLLPKNPMTFRGTCNIGLPDGGQVNAGELTFEDCAYAGYKIVRIHR